MTLVNLVAAYGQHPSIAGVNGKVAGPDGQLTTHVPLGYGFAAIIVAFVGRLDPVKRPWLVVELARRHPEVRFEMAGGTLAMPSMSATTILLPMKMSTVASAYFR